METRTLVNWLIVLLSMTAMAMTATAAAQSRPGPKAPSSEKVQTTEPSKPVKQPKPEMERPSVWGEPTKVRIALYVTR
jgi:hypothetical protein